MNKKYRFICYGKKKVNFEKTITSFVIGSKAKTFIDKICKDDVLFFYVNGMIHGSAIVCSEGFISDQIIWSDQLYPFRFKIKDIRIIENPFLFVNTEECNILRDELGSHWGYKVLFTPNELPNEVGQKVLEKLLKAKAVEN